MSKFLSLLTLAFISVIALADTSTDFQQGQWLEVRGQFIQGQQFNAEKISFETPDDEAALIGVVRTNSRGVLVLHGHKLTFEEDVTYEGIRPQELAGSRVKVEGELESPWVFSVEEVTARRSGRDRVEGPVDEVIRSGERIQLQILGYQVFVSSATEIENVSGSAERTLSRTSAPRLFHSQVLAQGPDDDDQFGTGIRINEELRLTSRIVAESAWENNFDFDDTDNEDRQDLELSVRTRLEWEPNSAWGGIFELRYGARHRERQDRRNEDESDLDVGEAYLSYQLNQQSKIIFGRQDFDDKREWLFDENLDALRFQTSWVGTRFDASVSQIFDNDGSREEDAVNIILSASRESLGGTFGIYYIDRDFASDFAEDSYHWGLRAYGDWLSSDNLWLEWARQSGKRKLATIKAYALDLGGTWYLGDARSWYATVGLAFATGDDPSTAADETFRQTGLQDNNGKFGGLTSFRYYGELSDPELSNLWISTMGIGRRLTPELSMDLVLHNYRLHEAGTELDEVEWDSDLTGASRSLGWEADVIVGYRGLRRWELEAVFGHFDPGSAFVNNESGWFGKLQLKFRH